MRRVIPLLLTSAIALQACATTATPVPPAAAVTAPTVWRTDPGPGVAIDKALWAGFGDPVLTQLVETAVANNTDVAIAAARVDEARAQTRISRAALLPTLDAGAGAQDARSLNAFGQPTTAYTAQPQLTFAYEVDLWGRLRDQDKAARASLQASRNARDAARLSVAAATANGYIVLRGLDARLVTANETLAARTEALRLARSRADAGYTSKLELKQAEGEYQAAAQQIPTLKLAISRQENALSLLLGQAPAAIPRGAGLFALTQPPTPEGLPSELLRRRPDIAQAENSLAASDAAYASARAQLLPQVRLTASLGALFVEGLDGPTSIWSLGGSILAPLFNGGRLSAQADAAGSRRDQAAFAYRKSVLTAFREVEDAMAAVQRLREVETAVQAQRDAAAETRRIARNRYQAGYASYLEELDAQRSLFSAELALSAARADRLSASVALYQAMGGGWSTN